MQVAEDALGKSMMWENVEARTRNFFEGLKKGIYIRNSFKVIRCRWYFGHKGGNSFSRYVVPVVYNVDLVYP